MNDHHHFLMQLSAEVSSQGRSGLFEMHARGIIYRLADPPVQPTTLVSRFPLSLVRRYHHFLSLQAG